MLKRFAIILLSCLSINTLALAYSLEDYHIIKSSEDNKILYYENIEMFCKNIINIEKILENTEIMKKQVLDKVFDSIVWKIENELNFNYKNVQKIKIGLRNNDHILNKILNKIKY